MASQERGSRAETPRSWREQALIQSPVGVVWELVGNPNRYPEWATEVVEVTGLPTAAAEAEFQQVVREEDGTSHPVHFEIEELDDEVRRIHLRCLDSKTYLRCALTDARGDTFVDMETGTDPEDADADTSKRTKDFFIRLAGSLLDGLRGAAGGSSARS